jgi:hypothetical protein
VELISCVIWQINIRRRSYQTKFSRALTNLFSRGFIGLQSKSSVISEKLEFVVSYTKVQFVVELRTNTRISCSDESSLSRFLFFMFVSAEKPSSHK